MFRSKGWRARGRRRSAPAQTQLRPPRVKLLLTLAASECHQIDVIHSRLYKRELEENVSRFFFSFFFFSLLHASRRRLIGLAVKKKTAGARGMSHSAMLQTTVAVMLRAVCKLLNRLARKMQRNIKHTVGFLRILKAFICGKSIKCMLSPVVQTQNGPRELNYGKYSHQWQGGQKGKLLLLQTSHNKQTIKSHKVGRRLMHCILFLLIFCLVLYIHVRRRIQMLLLPLFLFKQLRVIRIVLANFWIQCSSIKLSETPVRI